MLLVFTSLGHTGSGYLNCLRIFMIPYLYINNWLMGSWASSYVKKSDLILAQDIQFHGVRISPDQGKSEFETQEIVAHIVHQPCLSYRQVATFIGSVNRVASLTPLGHIRPIHWYFNSLGLRNRSSSSAEVNLSILLPMLQPWQDLAFLTSGFHIRPFQVDMTVFTNSSN